LLQAELSALRPLYVVAPFCIIPPLFYEIPRSIWSVFEMIGTKTFSAKPETVKRDWFVVDAADKTLGRLATEIASRLRGKHKPEYTPHVDTGDYIVVINAEKIRVTGKKASDKIYYNHSGYVGGLKEINFEKLIQKDAPQVLERAVKGMLPKNPLGRAMFRKLKVFAGAQHNHAAQQPQSLDI
jgi:large subunit ribosomal protein L13